MKQRVIQKKNHKSQQDVLPAGGEKDPASTASMPLDLRTTVVSELLST